MLIECKYMGMTKTTAAKRFFRMAEKDFKTGKKGSAVAETRAGVGLLAIDIIQRLNNH